ncbi:MAG: alkaline phosphatase PhoX [Paraglaciecola sp.]|uniref:alkaline phosphatase PhoX n=1 Tax=Paraglaciecola sp. TaxID=1920173 RepID=UPI003299618B
MVTRRQFNQGLITIALSGLASHLKAADVLTRSAASSQGKQLGKLLADPEGVLDLPEGFNYQIISKLGDLMNDGMEVPDRADGMGCFALDDERVVLVRNHEISPSNSSSEPDNKHAAIAAKAYDTDNTGQALPGGTSNIVYNLKTKQVEHQCMTLIGTIRNCCGGVTPWGSWLSCEESVAKASDKLSKDHGYVFEVPAQAKNLVEALPIKAMGRFNHEAACVDPATGTVYLTEDRQDSLLYRFVPHKQGDLHAGGKLQALMVSDKPQFDTRNFALPFMQQEQGYRCQWLDLDDVDSPEDDLRLRGFAKGAARFARGEGIHFGVNEMYFCCTSGGKQQFGQIMKYTPTPLNSQQKAAEQEGVLTLFVESKDKTSFNYGDNLAFAPNGHLLVCEDQYTDTVNNHLRGVTPQGDIYDFAKVHWQTEPAGACFSPDGKVLFVNLYSPTATLAITGPWSHIYAKN